MLDQVHLSVLQGKHVVVPVSEPLLPFCWVVWLRCLWGPGYLWEAVWVQEQYQSLGVFWVIGNQARSLHIIM